MRVRVSCKATVTVSVNAKGSYTCETPNKAYTFALIVRRAADANRIRRAFSRSNVSFCRGVNCCSGERLG